MTKTEAYKALQLTPGAEADLVTQAYWHLARKYQDESKEDRRARRRLDSVNKAYAVLLPTLGTAALQEAPAPLSIPSAAPAQADRPSLVDELGARLSRLVEQTKARWPGRHREVAVLAATTAVLGYQALSSGADMIWTLVALGVAALVIVAPRRQA